MLNSRKLNNKKLTDNRKKIYDIMPPNRVTKISKQILGIKENSTKKSRLYSYGWRFCLGLLLLTYLLTGLSPVDILKKTIKAFSDNSQTINLYAGAVYPDKISDNYLIGWWNVEKAQGEPDIAPDGQLLSFSPDSSAFYSGGNYSLICESFNLSDIKIINNSENSDNVATPTNSTADPSFLIDDSKESSTTEIKLEASTTVTQGGEEEVEKDIENEIYNEREDATETNELKTEENNVYADNSAEGEVEVKTIDEEKANEIEIIESIEKEPLIIIEEEQNNENLNILDNEVSFFEKIKKYFNGFTVNAQEETTNRVERPEDLGRFEEAKIKLSFALVNKDLQNSLNRVGETEASGLIDKEISNIDQPKEINETVETADRKEDSKDLIIENVDLENTTEEVEVIDSTQEEEVEMFDGLEKEINDKEPAEEVDIISKKSGVSIYSKLSSLFKPIQASAQLSEPGKEPKIIIWYSVGDKEISTSTSAASGGNFLWHQLDTINADILYNNLNNGYLSYNAPFLASWEDIKNLKIKLEGRIDGEAYFMAYLDSIWVEAKYTEVSDLEKIETRQRWQEALELLSEEITFTANETGEFRFRYHKNETRLWDNISQMIGFSSFWEDINIKTQIINPGGQIVDAGLTMIFEEDGEFIIRLPELPRDFKPGLYRIKFIIEDVSGDGLETIEIEQNFSWGVLAINTNKSVYLPLEEAYLQMAVLNDKGHTICDAELDLEITAPQGTKTYLSTTDGSIVGNLLCGPNNVIDTPDYYAYYRIAGVGIYNIKLIASTTNGLKEISDRLEVRENLPFEIERIGPTRIYPLAEYAMRFKVKANEDYFGSIKESVPGNFIILADSVKASSSEEIGNWKLEIRDIEEKKEKELIWENLNFKKGDELELSYTFDAPDVSPEFYLLGEASIGDFSETRRWQIASDFFVTATSSNGTQNSWTLPVGDEPWDAGNNTYASRDIPKKGVDDSAYFLRSTQNNIEDLGGIINSVEIGVEGHVEDVTANAYLVPMFNGSIDGFGNYVASGTDLGTTPGIDTPVYEDITYEPNRPNYPNPWTWIEIQNLDIRVYGNNTSNSADRFMYIDQIWIRVDYTPNTAPTSTIESVLQRQDATGIVDMAISVGDTDGNYSQAKLEYGPGADCTAFSGNATLDETDASATSTYEDVTIDNNLSYQIGSSSASMIKTASGTNYVNFDWLSKSDIDGMEGVYCLKLTANDYQIDQAAPATTTLIIDNKAPSAPGALSEWGTTTKSSIGLLFGATSTDMNFYEYKIFYSTSTPVTEADYLLSSSTDQNLEDAGFKSAATTSISGLEEDTLYYFSIWAYDAYGHKSSSSAVSITTNKSPFGYFTQGALPEQKTDGTGVVDFSIDVRDFNNDVSTAKIEYATGTSCIFSPSGDPTLDEGSIGAPLGVPLINNLNDYQIGNIITSATNTLTFDWPSVNDLPIADDTYCFRLTVNDAKNDQNISALATTTLDNVAPTAPGQLQEGLISTSSIKLLFGATTTETNFLYYKIFYKQDTSGVTETDTPHNDSNLSDKFFYGAATTTISGLIPNTDYVFNIWAYDQYGHKAASTEISFKTDALLTNDSLVFTNPNTSNYAIADGVSEWNFQAEVSEESGWASLDTVILRLADYSDNITPFDDIKFSWNQTTNNFSETGTDALASVDLSGNSTSTCAVNTCVLNFKVVFNSNFASSSVNYTAELYSTNDSAASDEDSYINFFQVKIINVKQIHFRWRNDDGGE